MLIALLLSVCSRLSCVCYPPARNYAIGAEFGPYHHLREKITHFDKVRDMFTRRGKS